MLAHFSQGSSATVIREKGELLVTVNMLGSLRDDWLQLTVTLPGFKVTDACLETARNNRGELFSGTLDDLKGEVISFEIFTKPLKTTIPGSAEQKGYYRRILLEAFTAVLQSEAFFITERGFAGPKEYDAFWRELYRNSCHYYSNLERISQEFSQYIADQARANCLYSRQRNAQMAVNGRMLTATASMRDSYHEMQTWWTADSNTLEIQAAAGKIVRSPDRICAETEALFSGLKGKYLTVENKREIRSSVDGPRGCAHFGDLAMDLIWLIDAFRSQDK